MPIGEQEVDQELGKVFWKRVLMGLLMMFWKQEKTKSNH